ncbi:hypothetical protein [Patulibacter americanus]|uniref:hypothetical protein n=1 Tax=Patulibacter americanus TaxID=588672 RepID=UPI0003B65DF1|nr:hypothetical protein [Patulibacter americanus]
MNHPRSTPTITLRSAALAGLAGPVLAAALAVGTVVSAETSHRADRGPAVEVAIVR